MAMGAPDRVRLHGYPVDPAKPQSGGRENTLFTGGANLPGGV
jgi:hypothetical protein